MTRNAAFALLILAGPVSFGLAEEKKPAADSDTGLVKVEVQGNLVRKDGRYCVQAKNPDFHRIFLVELVRTEDKQRDLDEHIRSLEGQVVIVRGTLRFVSRRQDGPELGIPIKSKSQVEKAKER